MQTVADMRGVGVKNRGKFADVLCGRPLGSTSYLSTLVKTPLKLGKNIISNFFVSNFFV